MGCFLPIIGLAYLAGVAKHAADDTQRAAPGQGLQQRNGKEQAKPQSWLGRVIHEDDKTARVAQMSGIHGLADSRLAFPPSVDDLFGVPY